MENKSLRLPTTIQNDYCWVRNLKLALKIISNPKQFSSSFKIGFENFAHGCDTQKKTFIDSISIGNEFNGDEYIFLVK